MFASLSTLSALPAYTERHIGSSMSALHRCQLCFTLPFPNFFRVGVPGISSTLTYVRPLLKRALGYSLLVCRGNVAIRERGAAHPGSRV